MTPITFAIYAIERERERARVGPLVPQAPLFWKKKKERERARARERDK